MSFQKTAVVDLDGTLSEYDKWRGEEHFGLPVRHAKDALAEMKEWGFRIVVFTTRGRDDLVRSWLDRQEIPYDAVNSTEHNPEGTSHKPIGNVYFDDRDAHVLGSKTYNWVRAMRRVRKVYQPRLDTYVDDASVWASWFYRLREWWSGLPDGRS